LLKTHLVKATYKVKDSFQIGLRLALTVFVFCFDLTASEGTSLSLTYGSASPFGSIGFRFRASLTAFDNHNSNVNWSPLLVDNLLTRNVLTLSRTVHLSNIPL